MKNMVNRITRCKIQQCLTGSGIFAWLLIVYSLFTRCLLVHAVLQLFDAAFHEVPN